MGGPDRIIAAISCRDSAAEVVATAEAAHAMALAEADAADRRLADASQAELRAAGDMAARIRAAVASGGALKAAKPTADAIARSGAEADGRAAHAAAALLAKDLEAAKTDLAAAQRDLQFATYDVCNATAERILGELEAAYRIIEEGHFALHALDAAAWTPDGEKPKRLHVDEHGRKFFSFQFTPRFRIPDEKRATAAKWTVWRNSLIADPYAASPWDGPA